MARLDQIKNEPVMAILFEKKELEICDARKLYFLLWEFLKSLDVDFKWFYCVKLITLVLEIKVFLSLF